MVLVSGTTANIIVHAGPLVMVLHVLHAGRKRATLPDMEGCGPQDYCWLLFTLDGVRRWSSLLASSRSKASGSNSPPTHSSISSCSGCCGSWIASRKLAYPQIPPQSSGGQARLPVRHTG